MPQPYSHEDDVAHGHFLAEVFADPRYLRVDGRPLFAVYRPSDLPDAVAHVRHVARGVLVGRGRRPVARRHERVPVRR